MSRQWGRQAEKCPNWRNNWEVDAGKLLYLSVEFLCLFGTVTASPQNEWYLYLCIYFNFLILYGLGCSPHVLHGLHGLHELHGGKHHHQVRKLYRQWVASALSLAATFHEPLACTADLYTLASYIYFCTFWELNHYISYIK